MLNPWVILTLVLAFLGASGVSFEIGRKIEVQAEKAAQDDAVKQAVEEAKANAEIDYGVQQQLALEKQKHDLLAQQKHSKVQTAIAADPASVSCKSSPATFSVLLDSIRSSNVGADAAPSASDGAVPGSNGTNGPNVGSDAIRARLNGVDTINLPSK